MNQRPDILHKAKYHLDLKQKLELKKKKQKH